MGMEDIIFGKIVDSDNYLKTIDKPHAEIHEGKYFSCLLSTTAAAASTVIMYIKTPDSTVKIHFIAQVNSSHNNITVTFANASVAATSSYTVLTAYNRDMNSTIAATVIYGMMPSSDGFSTYGGTVYEKWALQGSGFAGATAGNLGSDLEWVLNRNSEYSLRVVALTTANIQINARHYED